MLGSAANWRHQMTFLVAFDLDGTLIDTPTGIVAAFTAAFAEMGVAPRSPAEIRATIGLPLKKAVSGLLGVPAGDESVARGVRLYQESFRELVLPQAGRLTFPGVARGLRALRDAGFTLTVATSSYTASAETLLAAAGLRDLFTTVVGVDRVTHPKPHPETARLITRDLGISPDQAVMVGATTHDVLMAKNAGMWSIAVSYGVHTVRQLTSANPTWIADSFGEVRDCVHAAAKPVGRAQAG
jgi:phosphoglycolate phosphatase